MLKATALSTIISVLIGLNAHAQDSAPVRVPVNNYLVEGSWFDESRNGSGIIFDVQDNTIIGYFFGYDEAGEPIWRLFSSTLEYNDLGNYHFTSDLFKYEGGSCETCDYIPPDPRTAEGKIDVEFTGISSASVSFRGGEEREYKPLIAGVAEYNIALGTFPDLSGQWSLIETRNDQSDPSLAKLSQVVNITTRVSDEIGYFFRGRGKSGIEAFPVFTGRCESRDELNNPICEIRLDTFPATFFYLGLEDMSAKRVIAEGETGYL